MTTTCVTFSMSQKYLKRIEEISEKLGISKSEVVRRAIDVYAENLGFKIKSEG